MKNKPDKTPNGEAKLTNLVESTRKSGRMSKMLLAEAMGIDRRTYDRKLNSFNGFTDLELCRAFEHLCLPLYILAKIEKQVIVPEPVRIL